MYININLLSFCERILGIFISRHLITCEQNGLKHDQTEEEKEMENLIYKKIEVTFPEEAKVFKGEFTEISILLLSLFS